MGRKNKTYYKDLHQQAYDRLTEMLAFGESKKEAVAAGTEKDKIFSVNTYKSYWKHIKYFLRFIKQKHPECTTLKGAKKYVNEWLQSRADQELSAWTVQLEAKALGKLYGIEPDDEDYFKPPKRNREDIKRSRSDCVRDEHFSKTNNDELIKFCRGTGLHVRNGKGGRERLSPIIGKNAAQIVERIADTPAEEKVWQHIHTSADIHAYRAEYATAIYKAYARPIEEIPYDRVNKGTGKRFQGDVYTCRKDEAGKKLDKAAMLLCSKALGHNRISVVADNYIRGL